MLLTKMTSSLVPLFAVVAPLVLWPVEILLPFPAIVEELAKFAILFSGSTQLLNTTGRLRQGILVGSLFAFSETILYFFNYLLLGTPRLLFYRLMITLLLHVSTSSIISLSLTKSRFIVALIGLPTAIFIHYLYNAYLVPLLSTI